MTSTQQAAKTVSHFTRCPEVDRYEGTKKELRADGYTGLIPAKAGFTYLAFPKSKKKDTVYLSSYGILTWDRYLSESEKAERSRWFDENDLVDDSMCTSSWFREDRRKLAVKALIEIGLMTEKARGKDAAQINMLVRMTLDVMASKFGNSAELKAALSVRH